MQVVCVLRTTAAHEAAIRAVDSRINLAAAPRLDGVAGALPEAEVFLGWELPAERLEQAPRLRWVHCPGAGVDRLPLARLAARGVTVTNSRGTHVTLLAEYVLGAMLMFARHLHVAHRQQILHKTWDRGPALGGQLAGRTVAILGLGAIGADVARRCAQFGMRVVGLKREPSTVPHVETVYGPDGLEACVGQADYLVVTLPLTPLTRGMIGAPQLAVMKPTAVVVSLGRGGVVDEAALAEALARGRLRGAALDVFEHEPLPETSPLWALENVLITPHTAGSAPYYADLAVPLFCENLGRYLRREPLRNVVDSARGY
jgi:phosphoglycerate dehydrogenase-like enzyme